jgi:Phytanoyl-CoA dioxygenase (PhyH)
LTRRVAVESLCLERDGARRYPAAVEPAVLREFARLQDEQPERAGIRLFGVASLRALLLPGGPVGSLAASVLGGGCRPVRAILFDKTARTNWALGWHQDRVVAVTRRIEVEGFGPWSRKDGALHVAPPFEVLARMRTVRIHIDATPADNAPLLIAPGSHRIGRIAEKDVPAVVRRSGVATCTAAVGDAWVYATPILHASKSATNASRRRVLQVDYAADELPGGLEWFGV